ncbi:hypothetical protein A1Q1_07037 [Trichosporon asahii var. asahii CBS 2479]|uniref:Uncharacterized protein n=1 Tax=Trichosporon asahii var. asahii (strain ATCC 90039 / CBS 2479 / JCM 2466 / KCTC 7840 / NBRC 103889/ NCYC 2677 / UAMH 7654) TaxID=1186058 RepID=J4UIU1_TRIAS|nr:hypothetical protein A1Q1_07037 [Trichosporon asahii var. asahii CBS 2479]EJT51625.1 hypothetical protein A1Q1_07037 [Trichosporon asahii var. asahii CBS 2479]
MASSRMSRGDEGVRSMSLQQPAAEYPTAHLARLPFIRSGLSLFLLDLMQTHEAGYVRGLCREHDQPPSRGAIATSESRNSGEGQVYKDTTTQSTTTAVAIVALLSLSCPLADFSCSPILPAFSHSRFCATATVSLPIPLLFALRHTHLSSKSTPTTFRYILLHPPSYLRLRSSYVVYARLHSSPSTSPSSVSRPDHLRTTLLAPLAGHNHVKVARLLLCRVSHLQSREGPSLGAGDGLVARQCVPSATSSSPSPPSATGVHIGGDSERAVNAKEEDELGLGLGLSAAYPAAWRLARVGSCTPVPHAGVRCSDKFAPIRASIDHRSARPLAARSSRHKHQMEGAGPPPAALRWPGPGAPGARLRKIERLRPRLSRRMSQTSPHTYNAFPSAHLPHLFTTQRRHDLNICSVSSSQSACETCLYPLLPLASNTGDD